jgi:hypothetical protein
MYEIDFTKFTLGQGTISDKQQRLHQVVKNILNDSKQLKQCKDVV